MDRPWAQMEASLYQEISNALQGHTNAVTLGIKHGCPVHKIVWSSFNYMIGPDLKFVWNPAYEEPSQILGGCDGASSDGNFLSTCSDIKSSQSSGYQYDDFLQIHSDIVHDPDPYIPFQESSNSAKSQAATSTLCSSSAPAGRPMAPPNEEDELGPERPNQSESDDDNSSYTKVSEKEEPEQTPDARLTTSVVDSGITGTVSVHSDLSGSCLSPRPDRARPEEEEAEDRASALSSPRSDFGYCEEGREDQSDGEETVLQSIDARTTAGFLCMSSVMTELPSVGGQLTDDAGLVTEESRVLKEVAEGEEVLHADEVFVSRFVLAEQLSSSCFDTNPMVMKIATVPSRQLLVCSFLFADPTPAKEMFALSLLMPLEAGDWLTSRETCLEQVFADLIPSFKASLLAENLFETVCRLTGEFVDLLVLLGALESSPLLTSDLDMRNSFFMRPNLSKAERLLLDKSVTGCLMCQGNCVVIGSDPQYVEQFMNALAYFLRPEQHALCLKPHTHHYSPYLKLQAIRRGLVEDLYVAAGQSHWPTCFIDVDRGMVTHSGHILSHQDRKESLALHQMAKIFEEANHSLSQTERAWSRREPIIEPVLVEADPFVGAALEALFALPPHRAERTAALAHLNLCLDLRAQALVEAVRACSEPPKAFKESAVSCRWSLAHVRKMLGLANEASFAVCLARADQLRPQLAQFVRETAVRQW